MLSMASMMQSGRDKLDGVLTKAVLLVALHSMLRILLMVWVVLLETAMALMGRVEDLAAIRGARALEGSQSVAVHGIMEMRWCRALTHACLRTYGTRDIQALTLCGNSGIAEAFEGCDSDQSMRCYLISNQNAMSLKLVSN